MPEDPPPEVAAPSSTPEPAAAPISPPDGKKDNLLPKKTKLLPWEVEHVIPEPGKEGENLPWLLRPAWKVYAYAISTPRRRNFYVQFVRVVLVLGMVAIVTAVIYPELTNAGDPTLAQDPLTFVNTTLLPSHNTTAYCGIVDGGDEIEGNFSVLSPTNAPVIFDVLQQEPQNWSQGVAERLQVGSLPGATPNGPIDFPANYTDWYCFAFTNPNPFPVNLYVVMDYYSALPPV